METLEGRRKITRIYRENYTLKKDKNTEKDSHSLNQEKGYQITYCKIMLI
jgi:hypothetical protein